MKQPNFLILDEPTNDLDLITLNVLEEYLINFKGSVIIVSHDRFFLDKIADHLFVFEGEGKIKDFIGGYSDYREYIKEVERNKRAAEKALEKPKTQWQKNPTKKKLSYKEQKEFEALEVEIPQLEEERAKIEAQLSLGTMGIDELTKASNRVAEIIELLDEKEMRWLELSEI